MQSEQLLSKGAYMCSLCGERERRWLTTRPSQLPPSGQKTASPSSSRISIQHGAAKYRGGAPWTKYACFIVLEKPIPRRNSEQFKCDPGQNLRIRGKRSYANYVSKLYSENVALLVIQAQLHSFIDAFTHSFICSFTSQGLCRAWEIEW